MSAPSTKEEWLDAAVALAKWRAGRDPEHFAHALGVDPGPLIQWAMEDAADTFVENVLPDWVAAGRATPEPVVAACAMSLHIGVELGLWLAQMGRVKT